MKTIHRPKLSAGFTTLPNSLLRGKHLSFAAKGILAMMLSHSEDWELDMKDFTDFGFEGRRLIRHAVHELESAGHATRKTAKLSSGKFIGVLWTWHDKPVPASLRTRPPSDRKRTDRKRSQIRRLLGESKITQKPRKEEWQIKSGAILFDGLLDGQTPTPNL